MAIPAYVNYQDDSFCKEYYQDMRRPCSIPEAEEGQRCLSYDLAKYDLRGFLVSALRDRGILGENVCLEEVGGNLERLHDYVQADQQILSDTQQNAAAEALYELGADFDHQYRAFISEVILPELGVGASYWQKIPTFRVFFANSIGYPGAITYHSDIMFGHNPRSVNVFVPFTSCEQSRSLQIAPLSASMAVYERYGFDFSRFAKDVQSNPKVQQECAHLCRPVVMGVGEALVFDSRCLHAGPPNLTNQTRLTTDFRVLPVEAFASQENTYRGTGRKKALFAPGGAYSEASLLPAKAAAHA